MQVSKQPYHVLLSFDLEEFDIPNEFGANLPVTEQLHITTEGMSRLLPVLNQLDIAATFYTTAFYAQHNQELVRRVAASHEIASHSFYHSRFADADIKRSRQVLENISGQTIAGFRMPRLAAVEKKLIYEAGYLYDASLNPTWIPGRYNYLRHPRTVFRQDNLWILPSSVTPTLRIPMFWLAFKNLPLWFIKQCSLQILKKDRYLSLYYHPWEFADLSAYKKMPLYIRKQSGTELLNKFTLYLSWLQTLGAFVTTRSFVATLERNELQRWAFGNS
jgi:peptidoglycan/xylan/chitin deacetylase (PgdA/CDA1 family)